MLRNYVKIARRALQRRPGPTVINVLGLAVGLAACLLIGLWVRYELSYDDFHPDAERIYRIALDAKIQDREIQGPITAAPLAQAMVEDIPEVSTASRFAIRESGVIRVDDRTFANQAIAYADTSFFKVFGGFEVTRGTGNLVDTDAIVLTESTAQRLFGTTDVLGNTLRMDGETHRVTGVMADVPTTSHFDFDAVASQEIPEQQATMWVSNNFRTYAKVVPGASRSALEAKLDDMVDRYVAPQIKQFMGVPFNQLVEQGARYRYFTQPLTDIHLHANSEYEIEPNGSIAYVYTFTAIALFILLIACINFMNLATARATERATEVGMRKALGAGRSQLAGQFLGEAVLTTTVATVLALGLAALAFPAFNSLAGTSMSPWSVFQPVILLGGFALVLVVGVVAGSYPAFVLSRFEPARVLKASDRHSSGGGDQWMRRGLVVFQFAISIVLIVGTLVAWQQFEYIQQKQLGMDKERVAIVDRAWALEEQQAGFIERVRQLPGVVSASGGDGLFGEGMSNTVYVPDDAPASESHSLNFMEVGYGFVETMDIEVVSGRTFDPARPADSTAVLINQAAADVLGWSEAAGHTLSEPAGPNEEADVWTVIGIVDNFHYQSMRHSVQPLVLMPDDVTGNVYVRLAPGATSDALDRLRTAWTEVASGDPFQYTFLDQTYAKLHRDTQRTGRLFTIFAGLAVIVACLGLFGLATYTAQRRRREIGIRKALGATGTQIVGLLSKEFLQLVAVAFLVAAPVAYYAMQTWLSDFAYRVDVSVWVFVASGVLAVTVAFLTVSYQAIRASRVDPASTLHGD